MHRAVLLCVVAVLPLLALTTPVAAGNWATVRLDEPLGEAVAGRSWVVGFTVWQHDVRPTNDVTPRLQARHRETGEAVEAVGRQDGAEGHFLADVTFPRAGAWKWSIAPEPFPSSTSFEALTVLAESEAAGSTLPGSQPTAVHPVHLHRGTCTGGGQVALTLNPIGPGAKVTTGVDPTPGPVPAEKTLGSAAAVPALASVSTVDAPLRGLIEAGHAIDVDLSPERDKRPIACGDLGGRILESPGFGGRLLVGLREVAGSGYAGVAVLEAAGERTTVTLYLVPPAGGGGASAAAPPAIRTEIAIVENAFLPAALTIPAGTTVTWRNTGGLAHELSGDDLAFDDSGLLQPGEHFAQTFARSGIYRYRCGPHPGMEATITVVP